MNGIIKKTIFIIFIGLVVFPCGNALGATSEFNQNYIISDFELTNSQSMSLDEINNFLVKQSGALAELYVTDLDGKIKHSSEIIFGASQKHGINPKALITLIQKEQSLVTNKAEKQSQIDWATGFACYDGQKPISRFAGFTNQVYSAAWRLDYFLKHPWEFKFRPGQSSKTTAGLIVPQNLATAALYNYTPYIKANKLFWKIWNKWFSYEEGPLAEGSLIKLANEPGVWLIQNNAKRPFYSKNIFLTSHSYEKVKTVSQKDFIEYSIGEPMLFPDYSVLKEGSNFYLVFKNIKRKFNGYELVKKIGINPEEIIEVNKKDLALYQDGPTINTPYPTGSLIQNIDTGSVYYVVDDTFHPIISKDILDNNFSYRTLDKINNSELELLKIGDPIKLADGTLVKLNDNPTVYVISHGKKLAIANEETFLALGYGWTNVLETSLTVLGLHSDGETLDLSSTL